MIYDPDTNTYVGFLGCIGYAEGSKGKQTSPQNWMSQKSVDIHLLDAE